MRLNLGAIIAVVIIALVVTFQCVFTVDEREIAIVSQLGEVKGVITDPGLHGKWPIIQNVRTYDKRILSLDTRVPERFLTAEKQALMVDYVVKWRIVEPLLYYISVAGDEGEASKRLSNTVNAGLREEFGKRTLQGVISTERVALMNVLRGKVDGDARRIGAQIIDVRLMRMEFPDDTIGAVYGRMEAERKRVANDLRSRGAENSERIRADADRQRAEILATGYQNAQRVRGEGDAKAAAIYAQAFGQNPEFYSFYKSLEAYRSSFKSKGDVLVLEPSSEFFRYLKNAGRGKN